MDDVTAVLAEIARQLERCADELARANARSGRTDLQDHTEPDAPPQDYWESETLSVGEAAERLGISKSHAHRMIRDTGGLGPVAVVRIGRRLRIGRPALEAALAGGNDSGGPDRDLLNQD